VTNLKALPQVIGRLSGSNSFLNRVCGRKQHHLNDLTLKSFPLTQDKFDKTFLSGTNTIKDGLWGWENMSPDLMGKATNLVRKLRDTYLATLKKYDVLITPTLPYLARRMPRRDEAGIEEMMENSAGGSINTSPFNMVGSSYLPLGG